MLSHDRFADLAAIPGGWHDDRGHAEPPTTLDPRLDGSKQLVRELLRQQSLLRPHARRIHLGLDEPFDLNPEIWERIYAPETYSDSGVGEVFTVPLGPEGQQLWTSWLAWLLSLSLARAGLSQLCGFSASSVSSLPLFSRFFG